MVKKNERGITLIALVITIIILIILAGISINLLLGENGIITRSKNAKEQHEYAAAKEIIDLKLAEIYTDAVSKNEEYTMSKITTGMTEDTTITIDEKYFNATGSLKTGVSDSIVNLKGIVVSANQYERFKFLVSGVNGSIQVIGYTTETIPNTWTTGDLPTGFIAIGESKQATPPGATTYTVTFKDGETTLSTQTVNEGETVTKPTDPIKEDYDFVNWYSDSELTNLFDFTSTITGNTTIYAKWTEKPASVFTVEAGKSVTTTGTLVTLNTLTSEQFYVIGVDGNNVKLLAKQNVNTGNKTQGSGNIVSFDDDSSVYSGSEIEGYVNDYVENLKDNYSLPTSVTGRLMTLDEVEYLGGDHSQWSTSECPDWVNAGDYWLETAASDVNVIYVTGATARLGGQRCVKTKGVRPVLVVNISLF